MNDLVVMLTALDLEYQAVRERLTDVRLHPHQAGTRFEVGRVRAANGQIALALVGKGNHPAAVLTERAIAEFAPAAVLFVGVAGALRASIALGDLVVATHVYAYHGGTSENDGLKARPRAWEIPHGLDQLARHVARSGTWARGLLPDATAPAVHFAPIAAGEIVQDSAISDHARWVREHYHDAAAIEMEAAGVAQAGHLNNSLPVSVIRGISDRADGSKAASDNAGWQPRAVTSAAAFAIALAEEIVCNDLGDRRDRADKAAPGGLPGLANTNIATGNARVGVQAGQILGSVVVAPEASSPADLTTLIADFGQLLREAHRSGRLDESTYQAAEAELGVVTASLAEGPGRDGSRLLVALRKLRGLIADVTELAANLASIISAIRGMS